MIKYIRLLFLLSFLCFLLYPIKKLVTQSEFKQQFFTKKEDSSKEQAKNFKIDVYLKEYFPYKKLFDLSYVYIWEELFSSFVLYNATGKNDEWIPRLKIAPVLENYLGIYPLTPQELVGLQLCTLGTYTFFQLHNIEYLLVTIPDKPTVHPEVMPFWANWNKGESHYMQRVAILEKLPVPWVDTLEKFKEHPSKKVYSQKRDSVHWDGTGIALAYEAISARLAKIDPFFPVQPIGTWFTVVDKDLPYLYTVDLFLFELPEVRETVSYIKFLNMDQFEVTQTNIFSEDNLYGWDQAEAFINKKPLSTKSILLAGDSYTIGPYIYEEDQVKWKSLMFPICYYVETFYKMHYKDLSSSWLKNAFKDGFRPDIVVYAFCERIRALPQSNDMLFMTLGDIALNNPSTILLTPETILSVVEDDVDTKVAFTKTEATISHKTVPPALYLKPVCSGTDGRITLIMRSPTLAESTFNVFWENEDNPKEHGVVPVGSKEELIHVLFFTKPNQKIRIRLELYHTKEQTILLPMPEEVLLLQERQKQKAKL